MSEACVSSGQVQVYSHGGGHRTPDSRKEESPDVHVLKKKKDFIYLLLERGKWREKKREKNISVRDNELVAYRLPPAGDLACNPGMCPDRDQNQQPFSSQAGNQFTEPHNPGLYLHFLSFMLLNVPLAKANHKAKARFNSGEMDYISFLNYILLIMLLQLS